MNEEILSILSNKDACIPSFKHAASFESFDAGWQETDNGILMIGTLQFLGICSKNPEILRIIKSAKKKFLDPVKYHCHSESSNTSVTEFINEFLANTPTDCQIFLDKAYAIVKKLVYVYHTAESHYSPREHVPANNITLANMVRKHIPTITNADILRHDEFGSE